MELVHKLAQRLVDLHPLSAAATLETLAADDALPIIRGSRPAAAARVLQSMSPHRAVPLLESLSDDLVAAVLDAMPPEAAAGLLRRSNEAFRTRLLEKLTGRVGRTLRTLLRYTADSAATRMDPHVLALPEDMTVLQALEQVRESAQNVLFNLYIVDREHSLVGVMNLRELLVASPDVVLRDVMKPTTYRIHAHADRRTVLEHPGWREVHSLPVVDERGRFLGALRYRTLRRLQADAARASGDRRETVNALADLFWTGVAGVLDTVTMTGRDTEEDADAG